MGDAEGNKLIHHHLGLHGLFQQIKIASHKKETKGKLRYPIRSTNQRHMWIMIMNGAIFFIALPTILLYLINLDTSFCFLDTSPMYKPTYFWGLPGLIHHLLLLKLLQSCPTLCDPIYGSPPGSPVPGILQARTLEWVAIYFSNAWSEKWKWSRSVVSNS